MGGYIFSHYQESTRVYLTTRIGDQLAQIRTGACPSPCTLLKTNSVIGEAE